MSALPLLAVSMGDPAGIGAEVILKAATVKDVREEARIVVFGDPRVLERASVEGGVKIEIEVVDRADRGLERDDAIAVVPVSRIDDPALGWGHPTVASDRAQVEYIERAYESVASKRCAALVTAPISKAALARAGAPWPGHTEMLAELSGVDRPLMMLAGPTLKVVPMTVHVPLKDVPAKLSAEGIAFAIGVTDRALRQHFGVRRPRIAVAGLNPHAGEGGLFGSEEREVIAPAIERARAEGIDVTGPHAADTVFHRAVSGSFDVVIGMYHDQALIPLKLLDFDSAVNVTLGLPIIRTSVDHGTAYDIAGRGVASASSMIAAIRLASRMAQTERGGRHLSG
jgi:4-hydroxythreonine-4-phosphate dehydrogenase